MMCRTAVLGLALCALPLVAAADPLVHFVTRAGDRLMDGPAELRFVSLNIPNLHYIEDNLAFEQTNPWRLPDEFEIRDALESVRQMGGQVVRMYALSVRRIDDEPGIPRHVLGPGRFDEESFRALDRVLQVANETGVRVIIPFVDQWSWWGGIVEYAGFRGRKSPDFWTDPQVIADFKQTIAFVVNRRNTLTGTRYRDDKAVLAWETGNELANPPAWSRDIAAFIKSLDRNHLVLDGHHAGQHGLQPEAIDDPNIDILSTHHYPGFPKPVAEAVASAHAAIAGRKPYIVGEVGFMPTETIRTLLDVVISRGIGGALVWSLRVHNRDGGFYWHSEPAGGGIYKAYHWPGFPSGDAYDESGLLQLLREKAFAIRGMSAPPQAPPAPPVLLPAASAHAITWRGSAGASAYDVERAGSPSGPWVLAGANVDDTTVQYAPLFADGYADAGGSYFYRVRARNAAGASESSNIIGPIAVDARGMVDELSDLTRAFSHERIRLVSDRTRKAKEDAHRAAGEAGATLVYRARGTLRQARVQAFFPSAPADPRLEVSTDGFAWTPVQAMRRDYSKGAGDYGYYSAVAYDVLLPHGSTFLRITMAGPTEVGRVEIEERAGEGTR